MSSRTSPIRTTRSRVNFFMNKFKKLGFIEYNGELKVHSSLLRLIVVLILVTALYQVMPQDSARSAAVIAFVIGFFPLVGMQAIQRFAATALRVAVPSLILRLTPKPLAIATPSMESTMGVTRPPARTATARRL